MGVKTAITNETIELMHQHGSARRYTEEPVPREMIETIVEAGQRASTSSNLQMYSVVALTDRERMDEMARLCNDQKQIYQAPVFLAWCADWGRLKRVTEAQGYKPETGHTENFLLAAVDTALAMQNAALAAESLGLGFCYIGAIRNHPQEVIDLLELPELVFPISGMTVGWPKYPPRIRPRLPTGAVLHWDRYSTEGEEAHLAAYDEAMIETGIYKDRQVRVEINGEMETRDYGWREHSARRVSRPARPHLREVLKQQGFELN